MNHPQYHGYGSNLHHHLHHHNNNNSNNNSSNNNSSSRFATATTSTSTTITTEDDVMDIMSSNDHGRDVKEEKSSNHRRLTLPRLSISATYSKLEEDGGDSEGSVASQGKQGIENPGFVEARPDVRQSHVSVTSDDTVSIASDTLKRRNRMRSESAAAIAVLRSSQTVVDADTDMLMSNDISSEVVFNERTEL
ncbi:RNA polymerase II holoenzyme cyclin-like subunit [Aplysia californica]|uniref:RNA polymerase II holoenzyme cyclin-like subunit n=1 Tax=Aplysia californica TaxID=6500 RepID=A0ABM0K906_APLCA|nr:RNA polymerase II holoenzyme cyclin-like subunit [Aplysia californica]